MRLAEIQRAFQNHVLHDAQAIAAAIQESERFAAAARLGIYAAAYELRLNDALAYNYPRLHRLMGAEAFTTLARSYLAAHPSTHVSVRWFGHRLAVYLEQQSAYRDRPWLSELAHWEWAVAAAFDAADEEPMSLAAFSKIGAIGWPTLYMRFHPSLRMLHLLTNAAALNQQLADENEGAMPAMLDTTQHWLIWRDEFKVRYRPMSDAEAGALRTTSGEPAGTFADMCAAICEFHPAEEVPLIAAGMLKRWLTEGLIVAALPDRVETEPMKSIRSLPP